MGKIKITRDELKRDELKDLGESIKASYERHRMTIISVVGVVAALWIGWKVVDFYSARKLYESNRQYSQANDLYKRALFTPENKERKEQLESVVAMCDRIRSVFSSTEAARHSLLLKGNANFYLGKPDPALMSFTEYRETADSNSERVIGYIGEGYCHENRFFENGMEDYSIADKALECYAYAEDLADFAYQRNQALLGQARLYEVAGQLDQAIGIYNKILENAENEAEDDKERFGLDDEDSGKSKYMALPSIDEIFGSDVKAKVQIDRLQASLDAGEAASVMQRSAPEKSEEETDEDASAEEEQPEAADATPEPQPEAETE